MVEALCSRYHFPFRHFPPVSRETLEFPLYGLRSEKAQSLQEITKMLEKGALELVDCPFLSYYGRMFLVQKAMWGGGGGGGYWHPIIDLLNFNRYITLTKFTIETVSAVLGSIRMEDFMFSIDLKDAYFQITIYLDPQPYLLIALEGKSYQFKTVFWPFNSSPGLHQSVRPCRRVSSSEKCLSPLLSGWLASDCGVGSSPSAVRATPPAVET